MKEQVLTEFTPKLIGSSVTILSANEETLKEYKDSIISEDCFTLSENKEDSDLLFVFSSSLNAIIKKNKHNFPYNEVINIVKQMKKRKKGRIILITSAFSELVSSPELREISAEQAKELSWWKNLSSEIAMFGIVGNIITLGYSKANYGVEMQELHNEFLLHLPVRREYSFKELIGALKFFSSEDCSYIIGQTLRLDGGMSLKNIPQNYKDKLNNIDIERSIEESTLTFDLNGKTALVIGSSSGIGKETALELSKRGANVALMSRSIDKNRETENEINKMGGKSKSYKLDVLDQENIREALALAWQDFKSIDILIYASGHISIMHKKYGLDGWGTTFDTNFTGYVTTCEWLLEKWKENDIQGSIIGVSSVNSSSVPTQYVESYGASKAAMLQYTKCLSVTWAKYGIRANCVAPGIIETPMTDWLDDSYKNCWLDHMAVNYLGQPKDVSGLICYLASPISSYIVGEQIYVDGGYSNGYIPPTLKLMEGVKI